MKLHYMGKYNGDADTLPNKEYREGSVEFKEFKSSKIQGIVTNALGIAIYGMFIAIIMPVAKRNKPVLGTVFLSCGLSLIFTFVPVLNKVSSGFAIIICAVVSSLIFALLCPIKEVSHE